MNAAPVPMPPLVILPTYNEAENIGPIVRAALDAAPAAHVLIVDDDSPDGTGDIADALARETGRVHALHRLEKRGRGYAGVEAFQYAVDRGYDPVIEMDADFSHDPAHLPEMLEASADADVVIGSRRVEGGGETGRGLVRRCITWGARLYLRLVLGLRRVKDPTSGYRCFRRDALKAIQLDTLRSPGPSIVTEILFRCRRLRIKEIPIRFKDRERGHSKFNVKAMTDSILQALRLRLAAILGRAPAPTSTRTGE